MKNIKYWGVRLMLPFALAGLIVGIGTAAAVVETVTFAAIMTGASIGYMVGNTVDAMAAAGQELPQEVSPNYTSSIPQSLYEEGIRVPIGFGLCQVASRVIRDEETSDDFVKIFAVFCKGEIDSILSVEVNGNPWDFVTKSKWKGYLTGAEDQARLQYSGPDFFSTEFPAFRGWAVAGFLLRPASPEVGTATPNIAAVGRWNLCEPIGGGAKTFARTSARVLWEFYRSVVGKEIADLDEDQFNSLDALCSQFRMKAAAVLGGREQPATLSRRTPL